MRMTDPILDYYQRIKDGRETVGRWIRLWYEYIIRGLEDKLFFYDARKAEKAIRFIETFCRHHEGRLAPGLIRLEPWQKALIAVLFGIVDETGARQFREAVVEIGKKQGKTLLAAAIACYMIFADGEYGARVYFTATKLEQASLCYNAFWQMVAKEPELLRIARKRRSDVYVESSNSTAQPVAFSERRTDGINPQLAVADEAASWPGNKGIRFYENLTSARGARRQPLVLVISTEGYETDGIWDELLRRAQAMILGNSKERRLAAFLYCVDDPEQWNSLSELKKSMPNLGVSVSVDYMIDEIAVAETSITKKQEFMRKYCCVRQGKASAWLEYEVVARATGAPLRFEDFRGCYCVGGIDLSQRVDLTSACIVIERGGRLYVISHFWIPAERLQEAIEEDKVPYDTMIQRGFLSLSGEHIVDWHDVFDWFDALVKRYQIYPLKIGYDRYSATDLINALKQSAFHVDDVWQGTNLTPVIQETEGALKDGRIDIGDNALLQSHLLNMGLKTDIETNRVKPTKITRRARIDGGAALLDAMTMRSKYGAEIGERLKNKAR